MIRQKIVAGNWKMNTNRTTGSDLARGVTDGAHAVSLGPQDRIALYDGDRHAGDLPLLHRALGVAIEAGEWRRGARLRGERGRDEKTGEGEKTGHGKATRRREDEKTGRRDATLECGAS